jgi:hypothetical protein
MRRCFLPIKTLFVQVRGAAPARWGFEAARGGAGWTRIHATPTANIFCPMSAIEE